jgi:hypothetical protein
MALDIYGWSGFSTPQGRYLYTDKVEMRPQQLEFFLSDLFG